MEQPHINPNRLFAGWQRLVCPFTGTAHIPEIHVPLDGAGFHLSDHRAMQADFEVTNLGERKTGVPLFPRPTPACQGKARLRIREGVVAALALESRIARLFPVSDAAEEGGKGVIESSQDI